MMPRIFTIFLGIIMCSLITGSSAFSQGVQFVPITPFQQVQKTTTQNPAYAPPTIPQNLPPTTTSSSTTTIPGAPPSQSQYQPTPYPQYQQGFPPVPGQPPVYFTHPTATIPPYQPPPPAGVQPPQPQVQESAIDPMLMEEMSPFERYVAGVIPTTISFDIKQFGYDLFTTPSETDLLPTRPTTSRGTLPQPQGQILPGQLQPGQFVPVPPGQSMPGQTVPGQSAPGMYMPPQQFAPGQTSTGQVPPGAAIPGQTQRSLPQQSIQQGLAAQALIGQTMAQQGAMGQTASAQGQGFAADQRLQGMRGQTSPFPDVPVGPNYVLGPGDELRVTVWGSVEGTWEVEVDRDGSINLPKVGTIGVTGLKFEELKEVLEKELSKYYTDFNMNVSMGQLKTIRVYVVGNAKAPGTYSVSSLSTIINVLVAAGGPSKSGTMRDIQLKRNGETVAHLDLYDFLIRGDKTKDERVMPEDVIFIPPIGHIVGVAGDVSRPAIYELKGKAKVTDMIKLAGGTTASSYLQRIQVERVKGNESKILLDLNLQKVKGKDDIYVEDGDILKIFSINAIVTNKVILQGNVKRPGEYEWTPGMRVSDIIPSADSLLPNSLLDYAVIERIVPPDFHQEYTTFGLEEMLFNHSEKDNVALQPYDVITVYSKPEIKPQEIVRITGAVNRPGDFEFRRNMKVSDLVKLAGGLKRFAFTRTAELTRTIPTQDGPRTEVITVDLGGALNCDPQCDVELREDDYLLVRSIPDWQLYKKVNIAGEVNFPGEYPLKKGETLSSLIERAGGYTDKAYLRGAVLIRESVRQVQQSQITDMVNRLERELNALSTADAASVIDAGEAKAVAYQQDQKRTLIEGLRRIEAKGRMVIRLETPKQLKNTPYDITMEETDYLFVPSNPQTVQVLGAVYNPSSFIYIPKKDYSYYIQSAGGYSATADKSEVYVIKVDGSSVRPNKGWFGWNSDANQWVAGYAGIVEPGDTVIVPDRLSTWPWLPRVKDFTTVLYQVAVGAGVLLRTFP